MAKLKLNMSQLKCFKKRKGFKAIYTAEVELDQKICLEGHVLNNWRITEIEGESFYISFNFKIAEKTNNMSKGCSYYQLQRNADGGAILVRVPK